jgi:hypothetical protein
MPAPRPRRDDHHPDGRTEDDRADARRDRLPDRSRDLLRAANRNARVREVRQEQQELVATRPSRDVARPAGLGLQADADLGEDLVADVVPVAVVDRLEKVEVEDHQYQRIAIAAGPGDTFLHPACESAAVGQAGQAIDATLLFEEVALLAQLVLQVQPLPVLGMAAP